MKIPVRFPLKITRKLTGSTRNGLSFVAAYRHFEGRADDEIICAIAELFRPLALAMLGRDEDRGAERNRRVEGVFGELLPNRLGICGRRNL